MSHRQEPDPEQHPEQYDERQHEQQDEPAVRRPTADQPRNAEPRPKVTPLLAVVAMLAAVALVFAVITWRRYNT